MSLKKNSRGRRILKWCGLAVIGILVAAGVALGPMLLGYYRFAEAVEAASKANAVGGEWPRVSDACMPCHGVGGNPVSQSYPRLAGQPEAYLVQQLNAFASGERANATMSPLALDLGGDQIKRLSTFFALQPATANAPLTADPAQVKKGELVAKAGSCAACHGAELQGQDANARLAGQGSTYLAKQLRDFKSGARRDPQGVMASIAAPLSDDDISNVSQYLATLNVQARK
ncbi:MAG: c-type cytochrome [Burkholderiaceae bacterium]